MIRTTRLAALAALALVVAVALAACGDSSSGGSSTSTVSSAYKANAAAVVAAVRTAGNSLGTTLGGLKGQTDAQLTQEFTAIQDQASKALVSLKALTPPSSQDKALVAALVAAFNTGVTDIGAMTDAADLSDSTKFNAAVTKLQADSPAIKAANNALGLSVGVPVQKDTDTTATTATTDTTATTPDGPVSSKADAAAAVAASGKAIKDLGATLSSGGKTSDKVFAKRLDKDGIAIAASQIAISRLKAPTAADQQLVTNLSDVLKQTYTDVAALSNAAEQGSTVQGKAATEAIVKDAGQYGEAAKALLASLSAAQ